MLTESVTIIDTFEKKIYMLVQREEQKHHFNCLGYHQKTDMANASIVIDRSISVISLIDYNNANITFIILFHMKFQEIMLLAEHKIFF